MKTSDTREVDGHGEGKEPKTCRKNKNGAQRNSEGTKSLGFFAEGPALGHQLELFLCGCTMNKWLCGKSHLKLCSGKAGVDQVGKTGLSV